MEAQVVVSITSKIKLEYRLALGDQNDMHVYLQVHASYVAVWRGL